MYITERINFFYSSIFTFMLYKYGAEDVDECSLVLDNCTQICIDTLLSYKCACVYGYTLQSDGRTCVGKLCHICTLVILI